MKDGYFVHTIPTIKKVDPLVAVFPEGSDGDCALTGDGAYTRRPFLSSSGQTSLCTSQCSLFAIARTRKADRKPFVAFPADS